MYQVYITIAASTRKQLLALRITRLGGLYFALGLLLDFLEVFRGETGADIGSIALLSIVQRNFLVF
jgi:hypothetical protein